MKLHEDKEAFSELVEVTAETIGLPQIYVEKDYWVTTALKYLSQSSYINDVVFKGGTSLSKAYRLIDRFSEDIDLAVFASDKSDSARKKLLKNIENTVAQGLSCLKNDMRESPRVQNFVKQFINIYEVLMAKILGKLHQNCWLRLIHLLILNRLNHENCKH